MCADQDSTVYVTKHCMHDEMLLRPQHVLKFRVHVDMRHVCMLTRPARGPTSLSTMGPWCHCVALVARLGAPVGADLLMLPHELVLTVALPVGAGVQQVRAL
jgi:hypothetical protein